MSATRKLNFTALTIASLVLILSFQNCSNKSQFEAATGALSLNSTDKNGDNSEQGNSEQGNVVACPAIYRMPVVFSDKSESSGAVVSKFIQTVSNAPEDLRACTTLAANAATTCTKDSDFVFLKDAWGAGSYDAATKTFSTNQEVSQHGYPAQQYISRFKFADAQCYDELMDFSFTPSEKATTYIARLQWVRTTSKACVGPTPSPAPIGQNCSVEGQVASNECGTATCQFK
ncbi:MAG: hypothetical protein HUU57_14585 [Bdellovibrio sp.]|nr:hypothetical protein [Bdellovibrio sp.]